MKVLTVFGTRPEAIKMAPLVLELQARKGFESIVCVTAQHREMLDQVLGVFNLNPDYDLNAMTPGQTLESVTSLVLKGMGEVIGSCKPDICLVHGDTTTTLAASLASYYHRVPVGHVEAGLRTGDRYSPFPEEMNRVLTDDLSELHFAPTEEARANLLSSGCSESSISVTGNTVIDALLWTSERIDSGNLQCKSMEELVPSWDVMKKTVLVTAHRRESFGEGILQICLAIKEIVEKNPVQVIYPVHPNPNIQKPVYELLKGVPNVILIEPLDYVSFVMMMKRAHIILTDSGGVQEEAPSLGVPVLVLRENTERPEAVKAGTVRLVGAHRETIVNGVTQLLQDDVAYDLMSRASNPYGDGKASRRIVDALLSKNGRG
jgi:UDP-N-acetylglucosamine 2-epimerase (non-hydrolysing)